MDSSIFSSLIDWIAANPGIASIVIFLVAMFESLAVIGIVVPGIVFMLAVGTLVGLGTLPLWPTLISAVLGAIVGDGFSYWLGRHFDRQLRHVWPLSRYPTLIPKGERFFRKYGGISVIFGRFVGPIRAIIPAVAGIMHMPAWKFYAVNIFSAIMWAPAVIFPGVLFGESIQLASQVGFRAGLLLVLLVIVIWFIGKLLRWLIERRLGQSLSEWFARCIRFIRAPVSHVILISVVVISMISVFVTVYERTPSFNPPTIEKLQWWNSGWQQLPQFRNNDNQSDKFVLQWWCDYDTLIKRLTNNRWQAALRFSIPNSLHYLSPSLDAETAPVPVLSTQSRDAELIYLLPEENAMQAWVIYLWPWQGLNLPGNELWLGVVRRIHITEPIKGIRFVDVKMVSDLGSTIPPFLSTLVGNDSVRQNEYGVILAKQK